MKQLCFWITTASAAALATLAFGQSDSLSIGPRFHRETGLTESGFAGTHIAYGREVPLYKGYPGHQATPLPAPAPLNMPLGETIASRRSIRSFSAKPLEAGDLSAILAAADGLTHRLGAYDLRSAPSGGGLFPIELYLVATSVDSLAAGMYHFRLADSSLVLVSEGDFGGRLAAAALDQEGVKNAPANIVLTARFDRSTRKYADRGYRYTYMEAGAICQNIYLAATALHLGTVAVGAYFDQEVNDLLGIDGGTEASLLIMPVGYPAEK
ncbi:MAG: SagB/ThcOx family dehydrogenase [candidate division Zixibacteria bacterium]|nr:SagB/ThcOx family dehydrogenase [candidate division Zixibacteria bacterium]